MSKYQYEVREIDAWNSPEGWTWNTSYYLGTMVTSAANVSKALSNYLKRRHGITFKANRTRTQDDGNVIEIIDRKTGEPLFAAIPMF